MDKKKAVGALAGAISTALWEGLTGPQIMAVVEAELLKQGKL